MAGQTPAVLWVLLGGTPCPRSDVNAGL